MKLLKQTVVIMFVIFTFLSISPAFASVSPTVNLSCVNTEASAGSEILLNAGIAASNEILNAKIYVNDVFHTTIHNPDLELQYKYIVPSQSIGTLSFKLVATDNQGLSATSNTVSVNIIADTASSVNFIDFPQSAKYDDFSGVKATITDADGIDDIALYVNGSLTDAVYTQDGDVYTFTNFPKNLGDMNFEIKVTDVNGNVTSAKKNVCLEKNYMTNLFSSVMDYVPSGGFKYNAGNGYVFGIDKYTTSDGTENKFMKLTRPTVDSKSTYFRYQIRDNYGNLTGVFSVEFDVRFYEGFENVYMNFNPRGSKEPISPIIIGDTIELKNGTSSKTIENVFEKDKWYKLRYTIDTINKTYRFYVDDNELTSDGSPYALPLDESDEMGAMIYIAINIRILDSNDALGIDNVKFGYENVLGNIESVVYSDGSVKAVVADGIKDETLENNVVLIKDGAEVPLSSVSFNASDSTLTLVPESELISSSDYTLVLKSDISNADGIVLGEKACKSFTTPASDFDVVSVDFENYSKGTGVTATVSNLTSESKTVLMLMTVKDSSGAVERVQASDPVTLNPGEANKKISISPLYSEGKTVEVFFLDGWTGSKAIKKYVYKNN